MAHKDELSSSKVVGDSSSSSSASPTSKVPIEIKNDGSFMEQFKKLQAERAKAQRPDSPAAKAASLSPAPSSPSSSSAVNSSKKDEKMSAIQRRKAMEERMRNRGKRKATEHLESGEADDGDGARHASSKRIRNPDEEQDAYLREVRKAESKSLKDAGSGVRSLVK